MAESTAASSARTRGRSYSGLSAAEVQERITQGQTNNFKARVGRTYWNIIIDNLLNLFNIVLGTLLLIVISSGDYVTAFFAGFSVVTNSFLGMIQEFNAKRKLDRLAAMATQTVQVWRDGKQVTVSMYEVVKDDVIEIEPGDRLVVDGHVLYSDALEVDESLLTGESDAILKEEGDRLFSGSFCTAGRGVMLATEVGRNSNINRLSMIAKQYKRVLTPTQHKVAAIVELTVLIMFILVPMLFVAARVGNLAFLDAVRNAVVFVTSLVPQGLVLVTILSLTIGAIKISRHRTLIQRVNAVESLANVTVLCFDKTGTLTRNELHVTEVLALDSTPRDEIYAALYDYLNNLAHLNRTAGAVLEYVREQMEERDYPEKTREIPFTSGRKWGAVVLPQHTLIMGAPERILPDTSANRSGQSAAEHARELAVQGMRVLAFARMDAAPEGDSVRDQCTPLALIVMSDQVREDIQETLQAFREEGIDLKVISGDNLETVQSIALQAGMEITGAFSGHELDAMNDGELDDAVRHANLFARIEPETKRRIVESLQRHKQYVAMVGDGVNDVPALKQANLAIVMNDGTQISKDVADIVLLDNAMSTLPLAFHEGREITQTIFGTMKMFLVKNFYNVMLFVFIAFMSLPFPITPVQISWSAFGTVNMPATFIAFGLVRPHKMQFFRRDVLDYIFITGVIGSVMMALLYVVVYFSSNRDLMVTRSAITIFVSLYGMMIVWNVQGVDFFEPSTFRQHWRIVLLSIVMTTLTILAMYAWPSLFEFASFGLHNIDIIVLITVIFLLTLVLASYAMRNRYLLYRLWMLFEREPQDEMRPA